MKKFNRLTYNVLNRLKERKDSKIIGLLGSRQVGKTTLLLDFASGWDGKVIKYLGDRLEDAVLWRGQYRTLKNDLEIKLGGPIENLTAPCLLIFDEIQKIPEAFNNLKALYDDYKGKIKFAISGSSSLLLLRRTTESLGGRIEIATMFPLSFSEILNESPHPFWLENSKINFPEIKAKILRNSTIIEAADKALEQAIIFGLFPEAYLQEDINEAKILYQNYHQTYIEKDIRDLKEIGNVLDFDLVWRLAQQGSAQLLNYTKISNETGLAYNTVKKYISALAATFNVNLLTPYLKSIRRRLIKSPKLLSVDSGFFNYALNIFDREKLAAAQLIGRVFETIMIMEFFKQERSFLLGGEPHFFRTSAGAEVDLVVEKGLELYAYEFKFSERASTSDFDGIRSLMSAAGERVKAGFVISRQSYPEEFGPNLFAVPWWYFCL